MFQGVAGGLNELLLEKAQCLMNHGSQKATIRRLQGKTLKSALTHAPPQESEIPVQVVSLESLINRSSPLSLEGGEGNFSSFSRSSVFMQEWCVFVFCEAVFLPPTLHPQPRRHQGLIASTDSFLLAQVQTALLKPLFALMECG